MINGNDESEKDKKEESPINMESNAFFIIKKFSENN